jgi:hypothetical protein
MRFGDSWMAHTPASIQVWPDSERDVRKLSITDAGSTSAADEAPLVKLAPLSLYYALHSIPDEVQEKQVCYLFSDFHGTDTEAKMRAQSRVLIFTSMR